MLVRGHFMPHAYSRNSATMQPIQPDKRALIVGVKVANSKWIVESTFSL
jgi:hypothetical protein